MSSFCYLYNLLVVLEKLGKVFSRRFINSVVVDERVLDFISIKELCLVIALTVFQLQTKAAL
jgi:hypothetical protein